MSEKVAPDAVGTVWLVGAGPGDPGLLTVRGAELLRNAEVVVYDHLASPELLGLAPRDAEIVYVGKSASNHALPQEGINDLLVEKAKEGKNVVRLKGGDPYVFGRGGEEALRLREEKVPFRVIPGVSSTVAAACYAGIPLTHRDLSSQAVLVTGHEKSGKAESVHDWDALARIGTFVSVMGSARLPDIRDSLIKAGKDPLTPAAMVEWGTTPRQRSVAGPLSDLPEIAREAGIGAPALLVVGDVVRLRDKLNWFENLPLFGKKIVVTRTREQAGALSEALKKLGALVLERPVIKVREIHPNPALDSALSRLGEFDLLILTSPNGASFFLKALFEKGLDARAMAGPKLAVMGPGTALPLKEKGIIPDIVPETHLAEGLLEALKDLAPGKVLLPRARETRDVLSVTLKERGHSLEEIPVYETLTGRDVPSDVVLDPDDPPDLVTLTSASCAKGLAALIEKDKRPFVKTVSIGPVTTGAALDEGFAVAGEAETSLIPDLVLEIIRVLAGPGA
ncbi:MAG: uroporphyrinogen-III C-methyltransferase [Deltaproteobacteria bacterium]|jgi:uroporphyrinogen III methyltransferase/synthase|nr:uroporphyrinogen-III C-methyltransferase [Deltaproteobacteria bacterium]